jgi:hypothetical protein
MKKKNCRSMCRWTAEEDAVIVNALEKNNTIAGAIGEAFEKLKGRSYLSVYSRAYILSGKKGNRSSRSTTLVKTPCNEIVKTGISFRIQVENDHIRLYF